jgi:5-methylcytosine-specific restriction enzyme subunit McrC
MTSDIIVREYARLTTEPIPITSLDRAQISESAFDWLCDLSSSFSRSGSSLVHVEGRRWLKLDNYVGVIETPCGTRIEILPKCFDDGDSVSSSRGVLKRMIAAALDLPVRQTNETLIELFEAPMTEWVMGMFLNALDHLIKRGIRFDYVRVEDERRFLHGQLDISRQVRQPPGREHLFQLRHDVYLPDRPENRLLKAALEYVAKTTTNPANWRLAQELRTLFIEVPGSKDIRTDFKGWQNDRLMAHYRAVRPWCELILYQKVPLSLIGSWRGISFLFPMEKLFERYVASKLRAVVAPGVRIVTQAASQFLCEHDGSPKFRLQPDILIESGNTRWVIDTKWKLLDSADSANSYGLSQADFYQLYAYGQKYLGGSGEMVMIYPKRKEFLHPLPVFDYGSGLDLWVLPFDLEDEYLIHEGCTSLPLRGYDEHSDFARTCLEASRAAA